MKYEDYLSTDYWKAVAGAVKARAGWKCQMCNSGLDLNAHHRTYEHRGDELNHLDDLICLCRRCHAVFHGKAEATEKAPVVATQAKSKKEKADERRAQKAARWQYDHAGDMPEGWWDGSLSKELVRRVQTKGGAFTSATLRALGVEFPLKSGWRDKLYGKQVTREQYRQALLGRSIYA